MTKRNYKIKLAALVLACSMPMQFLDNPKIVRADENKIILNQDLTNGTLFDDKNEQKNGETDGFITKVSDEIGDKENAVELPGNIGIVEGKVRKGSDFIDIDETLLGDNGQTSQDGQDDTDEESELPSYYSSVDNNVITQVKDQGNYGTCWAFATVACVESNMIKKGISKAPATDLSEMHLAYFTYYPAPDPLGNTANDGAYPQYFSDEYLTVGGNFYMSMSTLANWMGVVDESTVPYGDTNAIDNSKAYDMDVAHLENAIMVPFEKKETIKKYIMEYGCGGTSYSSYSEYYGIGQYNYYHPYIEENGVKVINGDAHAVTIVGWDDNYKASNFRKKPSEDGAWLIKNSWGTSSNDAGYFWLSYSDESLDDDVTFFDIGKADNYDRQYQYDGTISRNLLYYMDDYDEYETTAANVFVSESAELLQAVSFYTYSDDNAYKVRIYTDLEDDDNPVAGNLDEYDVMSGTAEFSGYHTIKLNRDIILEAGERFAVVVTLKSSDKGNAKFPFEYHPFINDKDEEDTDNENANGSSALRGESFVVEKEHGEEAFIDVKDYTGLKNSNARIKAFTKVLDEPTETKVAVGYKVIEEPKRTIYYYGFSQKADFTGFKLKIIYSDGSNEIIEKGFEETTIACDKTGDTTVNIIYKDKTLGNIEYKYSVYVDAGDSISVEKYPGYVTKGAKLSDGQFRIKVTFKDGVVKTVPFSKCSIRGYNENSSGGYSSNVLYGDSAHMVMSLPFFIIALAIDKPVVARVDYNHINVSWKSDISLDKYDLYRVDVETSAVKKVATVKGKSYKDTVVTGKNYRYYVRPSVEMLMDDGGIVSASSAKSNAVRSVLGYADIKSAVNLSYNTNRITWNKTSGANGYSIYRKISGGKYSLIATVTGNGTVTYTDKKAVTGKRYVYTVRAYRNVNGVKVYGGYRTSKSVLTKLGTPVISSARSVAKKAVLTWKKVAGAVRYEVYYSTSKNGTYKKMATVYAGGLKYTSRQLVKGKYYYFKVRAYKIIGGKNVYSSFSAIKAIKIS